MAGELAAIGYTGPWDDNSVIWAYQDATRSPVTSGSTYLLNTRDGALTPAQITATLQNFGYPGPWDEPTMLAAYNRLPSGPWPSPEPAPLLRSPGHTMVVIIGGLGTTLDGTANEFADVTTELAYRMGYSQDDYRTFNYSAAGGNATYGPLDTCRDIPTVTGQLASRLRAVRAQGQYQSVVLVGHSLGGVLATDLVANDPDLSAGSSPFVRAVVTMDSPLRGVVPGAEFVVTLRGNVGNSCTSISQLEQRAGQGNAWVNYEQSHLFAAMNSGVRIMNVVNPWDTLVATESQYIPGVPSKVVWLPSMNPLASHGLVYQDPGVITAVAAFLGPQG